MLPLRTEYAFTIRALLAEPVSIGHMPLGTRRFVAINGGEVSGPALKGSVLPLGGDSQAAVSESLLRVSAHYFLRTHDDIGISVFNDGLRRAPATVTARLAQGEAVAPAEYYFRTTPRFEAPVESAYAWLNSSLFVASAEREKAAAVIHVYLVL